MPRATRLFATVMLLMLAVRTLEAQQSPSYEAYAIQYGTLANFPVRGLVAGADTARRIDVAAMVWLLKAPGGRTGVAPAMSCTVMPIE